MDKILSPCFFTLTQAEERDIVRSHDTLSLSPCMGSKPLEDAHLETELLRVLREENHLASTGKPETFKRLCDQLVGDDGRPIFGKRGSDLRRRVQKRREYFRRYPHNLEEAITRQLASPQPKPRSYDEESDLIRPSSNR